MRRRGALAALAMGGLSVTGLAGVRDALAGLERRERRMPALFIGHGSPMNAIADNAWSRGWARAGAALERPAAILCVSAHWETRGTLITAMEQPRTIHDFSGFPDALQQAQYPAPGSPALARQTRAQVAGTAVGLDTGWGLDHGAWSVLARMFPRADVPVVQLSLDATRAPAWHYQIARELKGLREHGVLILGSGNIVHNLRRTDRARPDSGHDWAIEFDAAIAGLIDKGDLQGVVDYPALGAVARLAVPTNEHYLPVLYALGVKESDERVTSFNEGLVMGSISMRSLRIG